MAPGLEAAVDVGGPGEAQLLQRGRGQAGLVALVAQQDDVMVSPGACGWLWPLAGSSRHSKTLRAMTSAPAIVPSRATWPSERISISAAPDRIACRA